MRARTIGRRPEPVKPGNSVGAILRLLRPPQWVKNVFVLAPLVFTPAQWDAPQAARALAAFVLFCCAASAGYVWNDLQDVEADRRHPVKRGRPLAASLVPPPLAAALIALLAAAALAGGLALDRGFAAFLGTYLALQLAYSLALKRVVILDVMVLALGFVLRVMAGGAAVRIVPSVWLLVSTLLLALFLGFTKRRQELVQLEAGSVDHRAVLAEYSLDFIDQINAVLAGSCIVGYALYTMAPETVERFGTMHLIRTVPFVVYGLLRYLYLVHLHNEGDDPSELVLRDRPLQACIGLWLATFLWIIWP